MNNDFSKLRRTERGSSRDEPGGLSGMAFAIVVLIASAASFVIVSVVASKLQ